VYSFKFDVQLLILYPFYALWDSFVFISALRPLRDVFFFLRRERDEKKVLYGWEGMSFEEAMLRVCRKEPNLYQDCQQFFQDTESLLLRRWTSLLTKRL
jgi:hypothetical protein